MSDLILVLHQKGAGLVEDAPPSPAPAHLRWSRWPWGWLGMGNGLRQSNGNCMFGDRAIFIAGRATRRGGGELTRDQIALALDGDSEAYDAISGMFLLLGLHESGFDIATDRFSHIPIYANTECRKDNATILSSNVEWIADLMRETPELDQHSVAELLLWDNITFPYTTRKAIRQLAPGSTHHIRVGQDQGHILRSEALWRPCEPERWPNKHTCIDAAVAGAEDAAAEIASTTSNAGVLLSGGLDSRIVAALLAKKIHVKTLTYADRSNRETESAARTAAILGVPHHLVLRDPEFYAQAFQEGQRAVGFEQNAVPCHMLCMDDHDLIRNLDIIVSGFGCDILLKGAYIPYSMTNVLGDWYDIRRVGRQNRIGKHNYSHLDYRLPLVRSELADAAIDRRQQYENSLRKVRPTTAEEWIGFYPISHTTSIDSMVAMRRFSYDEFYFHAGIVDVSVMTPWAWKKGLGITSALGKRLAPSVAGLPHADTGLPATWTYYPSRLANRIYRPRPSQSVKPSDAPCWTSEGSFVNYAKFFGYAPAWQKIREHALGRVEAVSILSEILNVDVSKTFDRFSSSYDSLLDAAIIQTIRLIDRVVGDTTNGA